MGWKSKRGWGPGTTAPSIDPVGDGVDVVAGYDGAGSGGGGGSGFAPEWRGLYDHMNTLADEPEGQGFSGSDWLCMTFTPSQGFNIKLYKIKLRLSRYVPPGGGGEVGHLTVSVKATDGAEKPTGPDLIVLKTDGDLIPEKTDPRTYAPSKTFQVGGNELVDGTKYAIVCRVPDADFGYGLNWETHENSIYPGGEYGESDDSGSTWEMAAAVDFWFELWGEPA